ncbi:hypothetical protein SADUNF_Sadunf19G0092900 [Salix dunnii]|uniref:Uncharacterized protein n=1 Tax=Salix dunnii TaxID=1413687 RepID=A0A835MI17_9ROSI|nr:hypothetical protein SADUNF_Sadunf19G0092900 [Salix dunnii]
MFDPATVDIETSRTTAAGVGCDGGCFVVAYFQKTLKILTSSYKRNSSGGTASTSSDNRTTSQGNNILHHIFRSSWRNRTSNISYGYSRLTLDNNKKSSKI